MLANRNTLAASKQKQNTQIIQASQNKDLANTTKTTRLKQENT